MSDAGDPGLKQHSDLVIKLVELLSTVQQPATKKAKNVQLSKDTFTKLCDLAKEIRSTLPES
jgi:hypothetical protein